MEAAAEAAEEEEPPPRGPATACEEVRVSAALVTRHVSLVATCPPGHPAPGHVAGCGRRSGVGRYTHLLDIPVTSLDTGLVYRWPLSDRLDDVFVSFAPFLSSCHKTDKKNACVCRNIFCALCHGDAARLADQSVSVACDNWDLAQQCGLGTTQLLRAGRYLPRHLRWDTQVDIVCRYYLRSLVDIAGRYYRDIYTGDQLLSPARAAGAGEVLGVADCPAPGLHLLHPAPSTSLGWRQCVYSGRTGGISNTRTYQDSMAIVASY